MGWLAGFGQTSGMVAQQEELKASSFLPLCLLQIPISHYLYKRDRDPPFAVLKLQTSSPDREEGKDYSSRMNNTYLDLNLNLLHPPPPPPPPLLPKTQIFESNFMDLPKKEENGALVEELNRVSAENKKLTERLTLMCENYNALRTQVMEYCKDKEAHLSPSRKRKCEEGSVDDDENNNLAESSSSDEESSKRRATQQHREEKITSKIYKVHVRTDASDTSLIVKDGYQWRKYGQKVTRDNPCPRAYFKCSFAPSCPVKKKVQRSVQDQAILVATYEGEHNHPKRLSQADEASGSGSGTNRGVTTVSVPCSTSLNSSAPAITLDLIKPPSKAPTSDDKNASRPKADSPRFQRFLVEQMASSLTKDPDFTSALAAAISGKIFQQNSAGKW